MNDSTGTDAARSGSDTGTCPVCGKPAHPDAAAYPFCSQRCRTIDLGRWVDEKYVISRPLEQRDLDEGE